jgi:alginate O-acetyltransferase complex protein AlgI
VAFNSLTFAMFLPIVLACHWTAPPRWRNVVLLVASYAFYGFWDWRFLGLLALSTAVDFTVARRLGRSDAPTTRRLLLGCSIFVNLGVLGLFKYAGFFADSLAELAQSGGIELDQPTLDILLPVGISFYTFQTMSYTIDVFRRRLKPTSDVVLFATYVAYFPQLVAGPIERAHNLLPRLADTQRPRPDAASVQSALGLILLGLFKKVVIADGVAVVADRLFDDPTGVSSLAAAAGIIAFSIQIYGDFSGYTDIARGVSRLLGVELVVNFRQPYLARNITDFWRRWHISLSDWLRDYLYIPLGGNRGGAASTYRNLLITMLLGGLWHGASWNFVAWGGLHGLYLVVHRRFFADRAATAKTGDVQRLTLQDLPPVAGTFVLVSLTWVFFRASDFATSGQVFRALAFQSGATDVGDLVMVAALGALAFGVDVVAFSGRVTDDVALRRPLPAGLVVGVALVFLIVFSGAAARPFVYFQF